MMVMRSLPALILVLLLTNCTPQPGTQAVVPTSRTSEWSQEVHRQLNAYRREKGLGSLELHPGLQQLCLDHSEWLRRKRGSSFIHGSNVSHQGSSYRARVSRIQFDMEAWGENVGYISNTPEDVAHKLMVMWKASPPHHKAMLGNWTHAATGIRVDDDGAIFATMNFGRKR